MKRIIPCVLALSMLLVMINIVGISPAHVSADSIFVDDEAINDELDQQAIYDEIFDLNSAVDISIDISKEQLADLQKDFEFFRQKGSRSSVYRIADTVTFTVNGKKYVVDDVGIRLKGTTSRCNFFDDVLGIYNLVNLRICFNCTFDDMSDYGLETRVWKNDADKERRQNRRFATMQSMELKWNITADNTYVRNIYMQEIFRDYRVPAQRCRLTTLSLGGCKLGIYRLFEPVDEDFIHRYFSEKDWGGDLYKVRCTDRSPATYSLGNDYGIGNKKKAVDYNFDLKTNLDTSKHESLKRLLKTINRPGATKQTFDEVADMDEVARVMAVNFAMGNQDDMRNNYNNHYLYFRKSDGKAVIIPYDNEIVMGDTYVWTITESAMTDVSPYEEYNVRYGSVQENPMVRQVVFRNGSYNDVYTQYLQDIVNGKWMTVDHYQKYYHAAKANYEDKLISKYNFLSTLNKNMDFSMEGGENYNGNMSIDEYMKKMKANILKYTG